MPAGSVLSPELDVTSFLHPLARVEPKLPVTELQELVDNVNVRAVFV